MSDELENKCCQATPAKTLEERVMSYSQPKSEELWWAMHEIERLRIIAERAENGIYIDKDVAKKWADEMLAQAKYARLSPQSVVDLLNEIRKGLLNGEGKDGGR